MKTRRMLALLLSVLFVVALFAGCGGNNTTGGSTATPKPDSGSTNTPKPDSGSTTEPDTGDTADEGPYHFAHDYELNEDGFPTSKYVYTQPLCDTDEVLTRWTTCYTPQYLPEEGFNGIETWIEVEKYTGVHIEYNIIDSAQRQANLTVLMASDDLDDILDQAWFMYSGTYDQALEDGYFADLYDYRYLMPNFMYEIYTRSRTNPDVMNSCFYKKTHIVTLSGLYKEPAPSMGYYLRQDWLDDMGMGASTDVKTYDRLHEILLAMKTNYSTTEEIFPYMIYNIGETTPGYAYAGYNTALYMSSMNYVRVVDGEVQFCGTTDDDFALMTMLHQWYDERLISPNFQSFIAGNDFDDGHRRDACGCMPNTPGSINTDEGLDPDPDCTWEPIPRTKLYEGQTLQYGNKVSNFHYGSCNLCGTCENLELAVALCDWWISDFGGELTSWGPEGYMWDYNENGERRLQDWVINHDAGLMWIMIIGSNNNLVEFCLHDLRRNYAYDGGERVWNMYSVWMMDDYGGKYDWPSSVTFNDQQTEEANSIKGDLNTFFDENYVQFLTGDRPLSDWNNYIEEISQFGYARLQAIYQEAYDEYMASL